MGALPYFSCEVTEDERYYYVRIHPSEKELAKGITGRSWDGEIKRWVYPRKKSIFNEIRNQLEEHSSLFNATAPQQSIEDIQETNNAKGINEKTISGKRTRLKSWVKRVLKEIFASKQDHSALENQMRDSLEKIDNLGLALISQTEKVDALIDLTIGDQKSLEEDKSSNEDIDMTMDEAIDRYIKHILSQGCKNINDESISKVIDKFKFQGVTEFVIETHEMVKQELEKVVTPIDRKQGFNDLVASARRQNAYTNTKSEGIDLYQGLFIMNSARNRIAHLSPGKKARKQLMGLLYALIFVEIWTNIAQD